MIPIARQPIRTRQRAQLIDITERVQDCVRQHQIASGIAIVHVPHTTAGITVNENADPDVQHDLLEKLALLAPKHETFYRHGEGNSDSHLKTAMVGNSVTLLIENGALILGRWQGVYFCEFDGPRTREFQIKIISD